MTKLTYTATDSLSGETPTFRRICGWCTCKFSWPKFQKMGFTAHHSASYVYPSMIWWGIFFFPFWWRIHGLRFWRHAVSRNSMTSNRNVSETVIFITEWLQLQTSIPWCLYDFIYFCVPRLTVPVKYTLYSTCMCQAIIFLGTCFILCAKHHCFAIQRKFRLRAKVAHEMTWICRRCFLPYVPGTHWTESDREVDRLRVGVVT